MFENGCENGCDNGHENSCRNGCENVCELKFIDHKKIVIIEIMVLRVIVGMV